MKALVFGIFSFMILIEYMIITSFISNLFNFNSRECWIAFWLKQSMSKLRFYFYRIVIFSVKIYGSCFCFCATDSVVEKNEEVKFNIGLWSMKRWSLNSKTNGIDSFSFHSMRFWYRVYLALLVLLNATSF